MRGGSFPSYTYILIYIKQYKNNLNRLSVVYIKHDIIIPTFIIIITIMIMLCCVFCEYNKEIIIP